MNIVYVSWSVLPSRMANAVQVIRMVNALTENCEGTIALIARRAQRDRRRAASIAQDCGLDPRASLTLLPSSRLLAGLQLLDRVRRLGTDSRTVDAVYSRVLPIFLRSIPARKRVYEMHEPPRATWRFKSTVFDHIVRSSVLTDIVFISGRLQKIVELEHAAAFKGNHLNRHVLHSSGASSDIYFPEPPDRPFTVAHAGKINKLDCDLVAKLAKSDPTLRFIIYGADDSSSVPLVGIPNIEMRGWIDPSKLLSRLQEAHVLIAPYRSVPASEWFSPVKVFEYAAAGRPALISDHPPIREIFPDGLFGRLLPQGDFESWRAAITELRSDPARRSEMGRAGLKFAERYSFARRARALLEILRNS